jgi:hypothetical protein
MEYFLANCSTWKSALQVSKTCTGLPKLVDRAGCVYKIEFEANRLERIVQNINLRTNSRITRRELAQSRHGRGPTWQALQSRAYEMLPSSSWPLGVMICM